MALAVCAIAEGRLENGVRTFDVAVTEDGFVYRVDLRLRPEGQRGDITSSLRSHEVYYEAWGATWERAAMIKARPVAGDMELGNRFLAMIRPFVYRKYLDYSAIEEIKAMKDHGYETEFAVGVTAASATPGTWVSRATRSCAGPGSRGPTLST